MISITPDTTSRHALIGYGNLLAASSTAPEALTPNTYQRYEPAAGAVVTKFQLAVPLACNYVGIAAHNIGSHDDGTEITIAYATTIGGALTTIDTFTPDDNGAIFRSFDSTVIAEIAITTNAVTTGLEIGVIQSGVSMRMEQPIYGGHSPIDLSAETDYQTSESETGQFLGRTISSEGLETQYQWKHLAPDWVRDTFKPFMIHAKTLPFFIQWRPDLYQAAAYGYTTGNIKPSNMGGGHQLMQAGFKMRAHSEL